MAKIKGNKLLPFIVIGIIILSAVIIISMNKRKHESVEDEKPKTVEVADLSDEDLELLGVDGDTEKDTVQTLITLVKSVRKDQVDAKAQIKQLQLENEQLKKGSGNNATYKIQPKDTTQNALEKQIGSLTQKVNDITANYSSLTSSFANKSSQSSSTNDNLPIGQGNASSHDNVETNDQITWIMPDDQMPQTDNNRNKEGYTFPTSFNGNDPVRGRLSAFKNKVNQPIKETAEDIPVYTVPVNSTLMGSVSMTALIGRIPIDGVVSDPYPFKAVIGRDNLIANGIELPNVEGAIVSGTASGDYVLSCVKATVKSITFVFDDGRISTIPDEKNKNSTNGDIGWISDDYGIPCISGEIKSNAAQYLSTVMGLGTAAAAADAMAQQNTTVLTDGTNIATAVTGSNSQYVLGKGLSGGIKETIDWFNKRYGQTFDAVYVPPGQSIAIHINKALDIDYLPHGRLVDYGVNTQKLGVLD